MPPLSFSLEVKVGLMQQVCDIGVLDVGVLVIVEYLFVYTNSFCSLVIVYGHASCITSPQVQNDSKIFLFCVP